MNPTAIGALAPRRRCSVVGEVVRVVSSERPSVRTDAEISDGTGKLVLRFVGRRAIPGLAPGRRVVAAGTPAPDGGALVMLNPLYSFCAG